MLRQQVTAIVPKDIHCVSLGIMAVTTVTNIYYTLTTEIILFLSNKEIKVKNSFACKALFLVL